MNWKKALWVARCYETWPMEIWGNRCPCLNIIDWHEKFMNGVSRHFLFFQLSFISFLQFILGKLLGDKFHAISIRFYRRRKIIYPQINRYRPFFHPFLGVKGGKLASNTPKVYLLTSSHIGSLCVCKLQAGRTLKIMALNSWIFPSKLRM